MSVTSPHLPLVSVIIPVYNMEKYLAETIDSVLESTYPEVEIILVDDGSSDNSVEIAQKYADNNSRIKCFTQQNAGAAAARNHAIRKAAGAYILPVDADDKIAADYIEKAVEVLIHNPAVKVVGSNAVFFGEKEGVWILPEFDLKLLARKNLINNCSMYRKNDWEKAGGYCEQLRGREDWDFWISMLKDGGKVHRLPITGLYYRIRKNSKRVLARKWKKELIDTLNERHAAFFQKQLGGKLRYFREMSRFINFFIQS